MDEFKLELVKSYKYIGQKWHVRCRWTSNGKIAWHSEQYRRKDDAMNLLTKTAYAMQLPTYTNELNIVNPTGVVVGTAFADVTGHVAYSPHGMHMELSYMQPGSNKR